MEPIGEQGQDLPRCGKPIQGAEAVLEPGLVLLGELHGSVEAPAFTLSLACQAAERGLPVVVGLEIPRQEQSALEQFLASAGAAEDRAALLSGAFWQSEFQDGRSSEARLELLDSVRRLRQGGLPIQIFAFDDAETKDQQAREIAMAEGVLAAHRAAPGALLLVLVGNLHARTVPGAPWDPALRWMGVELSAVVPGLVALDNVYSGGKAWVCFGAKPSDCGAREIRSNAPEGATPWEIRLYDAPNKEGLSGYYHLGELTTSPPARAR